MDNDDFLVKMQAEFPNTLKDIRYLECHPGWHLLLENLISTIEYEILRIKELDPVIAEQIYAVQIKQKFGGLRFYMNQNTPYISGAINLAEIMSTRTCELCGAVAPGTRSIGGWVNCYCDKCYEKARQK